ncbi:hypothetical protein ABZS76_08020 [Streptomyces sp. NPDC005562]
MEVLHFAADKPTPFWPTGAMILVAVILIAGLGGIRRERRIKKGKKT